MTKIWYDFFGCDFRHPVSPINSFENLKFSKLFDKDAISQIRGSCDCDGEILKSVRRRYNIMNSRVLCLRWGGGIGRQKSWLKRSKTSVRFFPPRFSSPNFSHLNRRTAEFAILCLHLTFLRIYFRFFRPRFSSSNFPSPLAITGPSNSRYCIFIQHF